MRNYKIKLFYVLIFVSISFYSSQSFLNAQNPSSITFNDYEIENKFPLGIQFDVNATSTSKITGISVNMWKGEIAVGVYKNFDFEFDQNVNASLFWYTNSSDTYIPPGTNIKYQFKIINESGDELTSEIFEFVYHDINFSWDSIVDLSLIHI